MRVIYYCGDDGSNPRWAVVVLVNGKEETIASGYGKFPGFTAALSGGNHE